MMIKNREELVNELKEILMQFDKDCNSYQTDVYFYYDNKNHTGSLDTFVNVGGNSWLNDDHMTIHTDKEHYDDGAYSWYQSENEIADTLEIGVEQLIKEAREYHEYENDEEIPYYEIEKYVQSVDSYNDKLWEAYYEYIDDTSDEYAERAEEIMANVEATPYFTNEYGDECWIDVVCGSNANLEKLNGYVEKYSTEHEVDIEELKEILIDKGILVYNGQFGGYEINVKAMNKEE